MKKQFDDVKEVTSIRLTKRHKTIVQSEFGSIQSFIDFHLNELLVWLKERGEYKQRNKK